MIQETQLSRNAEANGGLAAATKIDWRRHAIRYLLLPLREVPARPDATDSARGPRLLRRGGSGRA
jgi:hypothetical protein